MLVSTKRELPEKIYADLRTQATDLAKQGKYGEAINKLSVIVVHGKPNATDYNNLGYAYLVTKQYAKAFKFLKEGEKLDDSELLIQMNLAHAYLLNKDFRSAKPIYKKYRSQNVNDSLSLDPESKTRFRNLQNCWIAKQ